MFIEVTGKFEPGSPVASRIGNDFDQILDIMYAKIHRTLFPWTVFPDRRPRLGTNLNLPMVQDPRRGFCLKVLESVRTTCSLRHLIALLQYPPERLKGTWEGLGSDGIAENKALDALTGLRKRPAWH